MGNVKFNITEIAKHGTLATNKTELEVARHAMENV